ncbi:MAG: hypothetical protein ABIF71_04595 [Planctomycetota bacterium]
MEDGKQPIQVPIQASPGSVTTTPEGSPEERNQEHDARHQGQDNP